jgi:hypothetical protein
LYILSINLTALCQPDTRATAPFLYEYEFCTLSHFCSNLEVTPKPILTDGNFEGSKEVGNRVGKIWAV